LLNIQCEKQISTLDIRSTHFISTKNYIKNKEKEIEEQMQLLQMIVILISYTDKNVILAQYYNKGI